MPYTVQTTGGVEEYIRSLTDFSEAGKAMVIDGYLHDLGHRANHFLAHYPIAHESYTFEYEFVLIDGSLIYSFRFVANGSHMEAGIVQVVYVDHKTLPVPV